MSDAKLNQPPVTPPISVDRPIRDRAGFDLSAHLKITDPQTKQVLVNQRG